MAWTLSDTDENEVRVLQCDAPPLAVTVLPADVEAFREAANRAELDRAITEVLRQNNQGDAPGRSYDDLDEIRGAVGGHAFQPLPTFQRVP